MHEIRAEADILMIKTLLDYWDNINYIVGGVIYIDGKVRAYSIGDLSLRDTMVVHSERGDGYVIDYFKFCYGENSKWLQNFIEIEGRLALLSKNIIDFKSYIKELSPEVEGYIYRVKLMNLAKSLISASAEQYRTKYELQDRRPDDMKMALNLTGTLRRIYVYLNEVEEAEEQKKIYDLWKKKLDTDLKAMKK